LDAKVSLKNEEQLFTILEGFGAQNPGTLAVATAIHGSMHLLTNLCCATWLTGASQTAAIQH
jgi:hypothetical protein